MLSLDESIVLVDHFLIQNQFYSLLSQKILHSKIIAAHWNV